MLGAATAPSMVLEEDRRLVADESWAASNVLDIVGAYVAKERVKNRPVPRKPGSAEVLIVEDDPDQLALAEKRLRLAGYRTRGAASGEAFRRSLEAAGPPDVLLLDVVLPDCDGFDILSNLRRHPDYSQLPVVMLTVKTDPADVQLGIALGADGYITKPYSKAILAQTLAQVLGGDGEA
jgi:two-component system, OmpR family, response regulator